MNSNYKKNSVKIFLVIGLIVCIWSIKESLRHGNNPVLPDVVDPLLLSVYEEQELIFFYDDDNEMISSGEVFDLKFIASKARKEHWINNSPNFVTISLVKKVAEDLVFGMMIEYYSDGVLIGTFYEMPQPFSSIKPLQIYHSIDCGYIIPLLPLYVTFNESAPKDVIIDEIHIEFTYEEGSEEHVLKYNDKLAKDMIIRKLEMYYADALRSDSSHRLLNIQLIDYSESLLKSNFDEWERVVTMYMDSYKNKGGSFDSMVFEEFHALFFIVDKPEKWMTDKEHTIYMRLLNETNAMFESEFE